MQRCPYIHEMKERLLGQPGEMLMMEPIDSNKEVLEVTQDPQVGTIVKLNSDGYGSHTSPTHTHPHVHACTPLVARDPSVEGCRHRCPSESCTGVRHGPKNAKTSLFIIMSFIYAKLLVVICIAYVISDVITHNLPLYYYEGFFSYLYGMSILFLLYVFCFLLQESTCCSGGGSPPKPKPPPPEKKPKKEKEKDKDKDKEKEKEKEKEKDKKGKDKEKETKESKKEAKSKEKEKDASKEKPAKESKKQSQFQEVYPRKMRDIVREQQLRNAPNSAQEQDIAEVESGIPQRGIRRRKTTQNDHSHGSFFLRIGAIAFGLGTMIYNGLEFGAFFEIPFTSPCYQILRGVNPVLQMIFTFMQMYFIFMNSRTSRIALLKTELNIHRFKVIARFGLMHVVATNLCVWIRTLVLESLKEITAYHTKRGDYPEDGIILESIRLHTLRNAGTVMGNEIGGTRSVPTNGGSLITSTMKNFHLKDLIQATTISPTTELPTTTSTLYPPHLFAKTPASTLIKKIKTTITTTPNPWYNPQPDPVDPWANDDPWTTPPTTPPTSTSTFLTTVTTQASTAVTTTAQWLYQTFVPNSITTNPAITNNDVNNIWNNPTLNKNQYDVENAGSFLTGVLTNITEVESLDNIYPSALVSENSTHGIPQSCGRVNIMGTIVQDSAPYLYPFIIEYSLIGAAVIYIMWKHIGRHSRYMTEEDLEHRLEVMLSRRAVAMAHAQQTGRVDCVGASKGLFFGLLLLVGSLICLILFFVLIRHPKLGLLAIYLADVSHCVLMALSILAILIGFIRASVMTWAYRYPVLSQPSRVQQLKFRSEEQSDLNDILLRVSAFGLFVYAVFSVIAGSLGAFTYEPNLLVMITGILSVVQVVLQLLFIADVSRRRVHLPEQDRSKPARQVVTFLLICNVTMWLIYTFETQKVVANPVQLDFYGFLAWAIVQRITLPLCIFHRFHSAVTLAEIWKTSYKARLE